MYTNPVQALLCPNSVAITLYSSFNYESSWHDDTKYKNISQGAAHKTDEAIAAANYPASIPAGPSPRLP
jgi:hypothetical protein